MPTKEEYLNLLLKKIDEALEKRVDDVVSTLEIDPGSSHESVVNGVKSLMERGYLKLEDHRRIFYYLTSEGSQYSQEGSPEYLLLQYICSKGSGVELALALKDVPNADKGLRKLLKSGNVKLDSKKCLNLSDKFCHESYSVDITKAILSSVTKCNGSLDEMRLYLSDVVKEASQLDSELDDLRRRKLLDYKKDVYYLVRKTENFKPYFCPQIADLTQEVLEKGTWKGGDFKKFNFFSSGRKILRGTLHPLVKTMNEFRDIFTSMGFEEIDTSCYVESSFWCFDSLYIPQQHPARDSQDTFFTRVPSLANMDSLDPKYLENIATAHGDASIYGSTGWQYKWKLEESKRLVLRTHTTACSSRLLKAFADNYREESLTLPRYYFSIDKVFRNENVDSTHLSEFHQVEGMMVGIGLGLGHLIGVLSTFYSCIGIEKLRFKPAYNPYTEPSMEIFGFHRDLNMWVEIGNSGIFRPEMLLPMGFPPEISVVAWGLSLERPTMIRENIQNIRDLVGCKE